VSRVRPVLLHALTGTGVAAVTTAVVATSLSSPQGPTLSRDLALAPPAPVAAAAERVRGTEAVATSRDTVRPRVTISAATLARRSTALAERQKAIAAQQKKLKQRAAAAARAEEQAREKAAEKAAEKAEREAEDEVRDRGYSAGTDEPREIARQVMKNTYGWGSGQFGCYDRLIKSESEWQVSATNPSSGAYGIPQALPAGRMASAGADWRSNPATQIRWGLDYVQDRYGTPCSAWGFKQGNDWY
jgi:murein DD-endopeptidase MepM/ murein hydrolase activator NlpD